MQNQKAVEDTRVWNTHPVVAKTCLKCRQALMNVAKQRRNMAVSSACSSSVPFTTFRNNGRSPACVMVLDIPRNMFAISWTRHRTPFHLHNITDVNYESLVGNVLPPSVCLFNRTISQKIDTSRITKLDIQTFHDVLVTHIFWGQKVKSQGQLRKQFQCESLHSCECCLLLNITFSSGMVCFNL